MARTRGKKAAAARARRQDLPLVSPNWWTYDKTVRYVRAYWGDRVIADTRLVAAIEQGDVPSKLEQTQTQYDPPVHRSVLLEPDFYQRDYKWVPYFGQWILKPRTDQRLLGSWNVYFWGPEVERLWPVASAPAAGGPIPGSAKAWILDACPNGEWRESRVKEIAQRIAVRAADRGIKTFPSADSTIRDRKSVV